MTSLIGIVGKLISISLNIFDQSFLLFLNCFCKKSVHGLLLLPSVGLNELLYAVVDGTISQVAFFFPDSCMNPLVWCKLAYWEMSQRVGPPFPVEPTAVNVFGDDPYGDGLNLETLAQHSFSPPESVRQARGKIGLGKLNTWIKRRHELNCLVFFQE